MREALDRAVPLAGTPGQEYVERRGIPLEIADAAGVRYAADWAGRPAVIVGLCDPRAELTSVHGRYFHVVRGQDKMHTIGPGGGVIEVCTGLSTETLVIVEGLFDALSLAVCGYACVATIGRPVPWLPAAAVERRVYVAFDNGRAGEDGARELLSQIPGARRVRPPDRSLDWNTALVKRGRTVVRRHLEECIR
jgi:hypothetical protein